MAKSAQKKSTGRNAISRARLRELNAGAAETRTLTEALAVDFAHLLQTVVGDLTARERATLAPDVPITRRMAAGAELLTQRLGVAAALELVRHNSDTVRGCVAFVVGRWEDAAVRRRLAAIRPLADDRHFGVREWAWLAVRPHLIAELDAALLELQGWTAAPSENLRRFAVESTRPRGVWCKHCAELKRAPERGLPLLQPLRADPARYVQDSVANWLNDASKTRPEWVRAVCRAWQTESAVPATLRICTRALRTIGR